MPIGRRSAGETPALLWSKPWPTDVSSELIQTLTTLAQPRRLRDGERLYLRGDRASGLIGVQRGMMRHLFVTADGREFIAGLFAAGSWFGEISLFDEGPRPFDCVAVGETDVLMVPAGELRALLDAHPQWYRDFARVLCMKLRLAFEHIEASQWPLSMRLAKRLLDLAQRYGRQVQGGLHIGLRLSQEDLAHMLGVTRQRVNRELRGFERWGWLSLAVGSITLRDVSALQVHAQDGGPGGEPTPLARTAGRSTKTPDRR